MLAQAALRLLVADPRVARVHLVVTDAGLRLLDHELGIAAPLADLPARLVGDATLGTKRSKCSRMLTSALPSPPAAIQPTPCA